MKGTFDEQQAAANKAARAEDKATRDFADKQATRNHQGRKQASFGAPLKRQSREATGGYHGGNPFKGK